VTRTFGVDLAGDLVGHHVDTVVGLGWAGVANSKLLNRASGRYDAFVTMDGSIEHGHNIARFPLRMPGLRRSGVLPGRRVRQCAARRPAGRSGSW